MSILGFWGLHVLPGKTYTQVVEEAFRVSMASFGEEIKSQERTCVKVTVDDKEYVLCGLTPKHIEQQLLDHTFVEGEEVTFSISGENAVHLTGNYLPDDDMDQDPYDSDDLMMGSSDEDDLEVDSEEEDEDEDALINGIVTNGAKRLAAEPDSDEEEESDEEEIVPAPKTKNEKKRAAEAAADASANKKQKAQEAAKKPEAKKAEAKKPEAKKAEAKKPETKKPEAKKEEPKKEQPKATKLANGLLIEDVKVGTGPKAKAGQRIGMRYIGKLKSGKVFDKNVSGKPFNFGLGRGEVIKGWDQGIVGMQIGGERRLTIPAPLAYGSQSLPGIPKNSTLIFDVKLLSMK